MARRALLGRVSGAAAAVSGEGVELMIRIIADDTPVIE
jgi:hypothetical protein